MHTLLDLRGNIPTFIHISDGKMGDVKVLDVLPVEAGSFFVTQAKRGLNARRVYSASTDRTTGVMCDQAVCLNGYYAVRNYPEHLRRIRFKDPDSGKNLVFLINTRHCHR